MFNWQYAEVPSSARDVVLYVRCGSSNQIKLKIKKLKHLTEAVSKILKLIFSTVSSFHEKRLFYSNFNHFCVVENSFPVIQKINKINAISQMSRIYLPLISLPYIPYHLLINGLSDTSSVYCTTKEKVFYKLQFKGVSSLSHF